MLSYKIDLSTLKPVEFISSVFVKNGINLLYGPSGTGKTYSTIKALNLDGIKPLLIDLDNNGPSLKDTDLEVEVLDGNKIMTNLKSITIPSNEVIIIDTWYEFIVNSGSIQILKEWRANDNTIIIIGHNKNIATKQDIPDMEDHIANHLDSKLFLNNKITKGKITYTLQVMKLRGYTGEPVIENWMRD